MQQRASSRSEEGRERDERASGLDDKLMSASWWESREGVETGVNAEANWLPNMSAISLGEETILPLDVKIGSCRVVCDWLT